MSIVGACLLLVIALDLMASLQVHTADWLRERLIGPKKPPSRWVQAVSRSGAPTGPNRRQLSVQFDRERLTVSYDLWMPTGHPVFKEVRQGQAEGDPARFVVDLFGEVRVGEFPLGLPNSQRSVETTLAFEAPVVDSTASEGHIQVTAKRYEAGLPRLQIVVEPHRTALWLSSDLVVVRSASRLQVFSQSGPAPTWQSADVAEFDRLGQASTPLSFAVADRSEDSLTATLRRVGGTTVPVLDYAIWGLLGLLPLVLGFWFVRAAAPSLKPVGDHLILIVGLLLGFQAAIPTLGLLVDASWSIGPYTRPLAVWVVDHGHSMLASNQAGVLELMSARQVGALATTLLAAAVVWPVAVVRARQWSMEVAHLGPSSLSVDVRARSRARLMGAVPMVAVAVVTAAVAGVAAREYGVASNVLIAVLAATGMLATLSFLLLRYLIGTLVGPRRRTSLALIATLAATCVAVAFPLFIYVYDDWYNRIRLAAFLLAASILITAYALFAAWATVFVAARRIARRWSTALAAVVVLVILVLAVPDTIALAAAPAPTWEAGLWSLLWLASALGAVSGVLLVACLLLALKRLSGRAESGKGSEIIRQGGVVFAVVTFYWWGERWLYVPITLLLGWLVAAKVALPRDRASTQTDGFINRAVQLQGRVNAGQAAPAASDASPQQDPRAAVERTAFGQQPASINGVQPATAFASGDDEQASYLRRRLRGGGWRHGRQAALWGLLLGLPSSALYLWQIGTAPVDPSDYEALDFLVGTASWIVLQWAIFGFFFGYFYPYLRGGSGIPKALSLFALVILPPLLYHALWSQLEAWRAYGFFALQMFVFTMLLGLLAGDYLLLQRVNMGWQQFRDVHNLRVVLTWGSSVAVALGGIITTLLTTSASEVVSALLEQAGIGGGGAGPPGPQSR